MCRPPGRRRTAVPHHHGEGIIDMALSYGFANFLLYCKKNMGVNFSKTISLGRPHMLLTRAETRKLLRGHGYTPIDRDIEAICSEKYADQFFRFMGCDDIKYLDYSDFEGADIVHDLNLPVDPKHWNAYSCVVEGGTIEHIFNFPTVIDNCMKMALVGGHVLSFNVANNWLGHGFYQFSPELFFNTFCKKNGFKTNKVFLAERHSESWCDVPDPADLQERLQIINTRRTNILTVAQRISEQAGILSIPQQSFYEKNWEEGDDAESIKALVRGDVSGSKAKMKERLASILGVKALHLAQALYERWTFYRIFARHQRKIRPMAQ
jgi:hypothetical protein